MIRRFSSESIDRWMKTEYWISPESLGIYRIAYVILIFVFAGPPSFIWLGDVPSFLLNPPVLSLTSPVASLPPTSFFFLLTIAATLLYVALLFGYRTRFAGISLSLVLLIGNSFTYSFGKINHDELFAMIVPLVMSFSGWGDRYSIDARRGPRRPAASGWPIALLAILLGFAMFTAGVPKLLGGWLDPSTSAVRGHLINRFYVTGINDYLAASLVDIRAGWFWEIMDWIPVLWEIGFLVAVVRRKAFRLFVATAPLFHLANLLVLNIAFSANLFLYLLFIPWEPVMGLAQRKPIARILDFFGRAPAYVATSTAMLVFVVARGVFNPGINENALRSFTNRGDDTGVISLLDLVTVPLGIRVDLNLILLVASSLIAFLLVVRAWRLPRSAIVAAGPGSD